MKIKLIKNLTFKDQAGKITHFIPIGTILKVGDTVVCGCYHTFPLGGILLEEFEVVSDDEVVATGPWEIAV